VLKDQLVLQVGMETKVIQEAQDQLVLQDFLEQELVALSLVRLVVLVELLVQMELLVVLVLEDQVVHLEEQEAITYKILAT